MKEEKQLLTGLSCMLGAFLIWGFQPLYWALSDMDTLFLMLWRICTAALFCLLILKGTGKLKELSEAFSDREVLKKEIPAAVLLAGDWFVYLFAVKSGKIQEVSLGYYCMPIVIYVLGAVIYKEKASLSHLLVLVLIIAGILSGTKGFGGFPWVAVFLSLDFAFYTAIKKGSKLSGLVSTSMEILMMFPFALFFLFVLYGGEKGLSVMTAADRLYVIGAGLVTALPMLLYSAGVKTVSMMTTALMHYTGPTFTLICSFLLGEELTASGIISFLFIFAALVVYTVTMFRKAKGENNEV